MKTAAIPADRPAVQDLLELTKPRLTFFVLVVVLLSAWLAGGGVLVMLHAVMGAALVAAGASALNMFVERAPDGRMARTWNRPLPSGRLRPGEVLAFGIATGVLGTLQLALAATPLAAGLAALTLLSYVFLYTPLKRVTTLNTHIGAIPGALPALIGWAAVRGSLGPEAWALFSIVYLWQVPHFLSIAWIYRADYARGGFQMLPVVDPTGATTGRQATLGVLALLPVSLLPSLWGFAGAAYAAGAVVLGLFFLYRAVVFMLLRSNGNARLLMRASLLYLPLLLALLFLDRVA